MIDLVLSVALLALIIDITLALYFTKKAKLGSVMENIEGWVEEWRNSGGLDQYVWEENGEWRMDERIGKLVDFVGSRIALSMRTSVMQGMSVDSKLAKNVDKAIGADMLNGSGIGGLLDLIGMSETKNMLIKNPKTLGLILQRVSPLLEKYLGGQSPGSSHGEM